MEYEQGHARFQSASAVSIQPSAFSQHETAQRVKQCVALCVCIRNVGGITTPRGSMMHRPHAKARRREGDKRKSELLFFSSLLRASAPSREALEQLTRRVAEPAAQRMARTRTRVARQHFRAFAKPQTRPPRRRSFLTHTRTHRFALHEDTTRPLVSPKLLGPTLDLTHGRETQWHGKRRKLHRLRSMRRRSNWGESFGRRWMTGDRRSLTAVGGSITCSNGRCPIPRSRSRCSGLSMSCRR